MQISRSRPLFQWSRSRNLKRLRVSTTAKSYTNLDIMYCKLSKLFLTINFLFHIEKSRLNKITRTLGVYFKENVQNAVHFKTRNRSRDGTGAGAGDNRKGTDLATLIQIHCLE